MPRHGGRGRGAAASEESEHRSESAPQVLTQRRPQRNWQHQRGICHADGDRGGRDVSRLAERTKTFAATASGINKASRTPTVSGRMRTAAVKRQCRVPAQ